MATRLILFFLTNLAVVTTISVILGLLGVRPNEGLIPLAIFCFVWGMGGALISLLISRWMAKRGMGVQLVNGNTGNPDADWLHRTVSVWPSSPNCPCPRSGSTTRRR